jgi:hypothetical protein
MDRKDWTEEERNVLYHQYQSSGGSGGGCIYIKFSAIEGRQNGYYSVVSGGFSLFNPKKLTDGAFFEILIRVWFGNLVKCLVRSVGDKWI